MFKINDLIQSLEVFQFLLDAGCVSKYNNISHKHNNPCCFVGCVCLLAWDCVFFIFLMPSSLKKMYKDVVFYDLFQTTPIHFA